MLIQKFVAESKGKDIRAFVVGDRVVAAMRRVAQGDEFRSNVHRGGKAEAIELEPAFEETAVRAAQIMGLSVAGVDMLESQDGPQVMEVNSSPGLEGIEGATKLDIAGADHRLHRRPGAASRRSTSASGSPSAAATASPSCTCPTGSEYVGKTIAESGLRDKDINVLSLRRGITVIPNPKSSRPLEGGDRLLCFGKLDSMRHLVPERTRRRRRPHIEELPPPAAS